MMFRLELYLEDDEVEDLKDLLEVCCYGNLPYLNSQIAEIILKKIEDEE